MRERTRIHRGKVDPQENEQHLKSSGPTPLDALVVDNRMKKGVRDVLDGGGQKLASTTRAEMESRFGFDFSRVRLFSDERAAASAKTLGADAYTVGPNIVFASGRYQPTSHDGQQLLAHELAHVVQQSSGPVAGERVAPGFSVSTPDDPFERAASHSATAVTAASATPAVDRSLVPHAVVAAKHGQDFSASVSVQRAPAVGQPTPHQAENPNSYVDLLNGINEIVTTAHDRHGVGLPDVHFGGRLSKHQRELLVDLRTAIQLAYTPPPGSILSGLDLWRSLEGELSAAIGQATELGVPASDAAEIRRDLTWVDQEVMRPAALAAYGYAHREALASGDLQAPDLVTQQAKLEREEIELEEAKALAEKAGQLTSMGIGEIVLRDAGIGKEIFEIATMPGEIEEKLEEAKKKGLLLQTATAVELVSKIAGAKNTIIKTTFQYLKGAAEKEALKAGSKELAEHWKELARGYEEYEHAFKTIGTVIGIVGVAADAIRAFEAALRHDWYEAASRMGRVGTGVLGMLAVEGSGGLLMAITVTAQAEMEAIHLAAEFIRWCQDENVRQAAGSFITTCAAVARNPAQDLVADANALFNPSNAIISDIITNKLTGYAPAMRKGLAAIGAHVQATDPRSLGHYGALVEALGPDAKRVLLAPFAFPDDPLSMATQIRDVFAGANAMARYVKEQYPTDAEKAAKDAKEGKKKGEE